MQKEPAGDAKRELVVRELMKHRSGLFAFILSLVRDFSLAEEVMQEVAVVVCAQWDDFRPGTNFGAWARQIARNKIYNMNRAAGREMALSPEAIEAVERAEQAEADSGWTEALKTCLEEATGRVRAMIALRYREGFSGAQIARQLDTTVTAVHMALSRARAALATCVRTRLAEGNSP